MNSSTPAPLPSARARASSCTNGREGISGSRPASRDAAQDDLSPASEPMNRLGSIFFWFACLALPVLILVVLSVWGGVYPFGPESFLTEDLKYQYIDFFTWFRHVLTGEANIFYSFAQGMGSNAWGLYSYYLASPFNLIILLFDEAHLTLAIYVIVALKLACMNTAMAWYLRRRFSLQRSWALALALCYTWSTWTATNLRNPLWLDALILLPLMAWGCRKLLQDGSIVGLALLVAADVITCWYMAYITLLFCCLFVLFELAVMIFDEGEKPSGKWVAGRAGRFTAAILLGIGLSCWTFVPTILAMIGGEATKAFSHFHTYPTALIRGFLPTAWNLDHVPQFYTGLIPPILALAMLLEKRVDKRLRALTFFFAGFLVVSSVLGVLMYVWCGFRQPNGFYCRIAFLLSFLEIWAAAYLLMRRAGLRPVEQDDRRAPWHDRDATPKCLNLMLRRVAPFGAIAFVVMDLGLNAHVCWNQLYVNYPQEVHDAYVNAVDAQMEELEELDSDAFYRVDKTYNRAGAAFNEGIAHGFNQLSTYSSANSPKAVALLNTLGYSSEGEFSSVYTAPNLVMDSLLGVRYVATWGTPAGYAPMDMGPSHNGATYSRNPYALSFGLSTAANAEDLTAPLVGDNPFDRMNDLVWRLTKSDKPLFTELEAELVRDDPDHMVWEISVPARSIGYAYVLKGPDAGSYQPVQLTIDQQTITQEGWRFANNVRELNSHVEDEPSMHRVAIDPTDGSESVPKDTNCTFYALDIAAFEEFITSLSATQFEPSIFEDGWVTGTYRTEEPSALLLSMPYDRGWTVKVDGRPTELLSAFDGGMSAIQVHKGEHQIEMSYRSPGLVVGLAISTLSLVSLIAYAARSIKATRP